MRAVKVTMLPRIAFRVGVGTGIPVSQQDSKNSIRTGHKNPELHKNLWADKVFVGVDTGHGCKKKMRRGTGTQDEEGGRQAPGTVCRPPEVACRDLGSREQVAGLACKPCTPWMMDAGRVLP